VNLHRLFRKADLFPSSDQNWEVTQLPYLQYFSFLSVTSQTLKSLRMEKVKHPKCCALFGETHKPNHAKRNGGEPSSEPFRINPEKFLM
jgi:hypothetical protein